MTNLFTQFYFLSSRLQIIIPVRPRVRCESVNMKVVLVAAGGQWPPPADCRDPMLEPNFSRARPGPSCVRCRVWGGYTGYLLYCGLYVDVVYVVDTTRLWDLHWTIPLWLTALCCPRLSSLSSAPRLWADWRRICVRAQSAQCCASARWPGPAAGDVPSLPAPLTLSFSPRSSCCWLLAAGPGSPPH